MTDKGNHSLIARDLSVDYYGRNVVRDLSFEVRSGEVFGLLGPSGAGKSSVLAALTGVVPANGTIHIGETDISALPARHRNFGHVYQEFRLFDWMSIWDNIAFPCRAKRWSQPDIEEAVSDVIRQVGLLGSTARRVRDLSGGERQRVALARAMVFRPSVLLLDEPFSHLDPPLRQELKLNLVRFLQGSAIPVILVTHDHREAFELCDRIGIMLAGELQQTGEPVNLLAEPATLEVARILGYSNECVGQVDGVAGAHVEVSLGRSGMTLRGRADRSNLHVGDAVRVLCRPEKLRLTEKPNMVSNCLEARVLMAHTSTDETVVTIEFQDGTTWTARMSGLAQLEVGRVVTCAVSPDDLVVYRSMSA